LCTANRRCDGDKEVDASEVLRKTTSLSDRAADSMLDKKSG